MILLPRLDRGEVDVVSAQLTERLADPEDALKVVDQLELKPHWNPSGGYEIPFEDLQAFARQIELLAREQGYPRYPDIVCQQAFDRSVCRLLDRTEFLKKAGGDTRRAATWAGLTCLAVPHLAIWRHSAEGKGISRDRLHGGPRNFLRRLWLRNAALLLEPCDNENPWVLVDELSEDAVVQIVERPSLASDKRVSCFIGMEWRKHRRKSMNMEPIMRLVTRRIRATSQTQMLTILDDQKLEQVVAQAFEHAIRQIHHADEISESGG